MGVAAVSAAVGLLRYDFHFDIGVAHASTGVIANFEVAGLDKEMGL